MARFFALIRRSQQTTQPSISTALLQTHIVCGSLSEHKAKERPFECSLLRHHHNSIFYSWGPPLQALLLHSAEYFYLAYSITPTFAYRTRNQNGLTVGTLTALTRFTHCSFVPLAWVFHFFLSAQRRASVWSSRAASKEKHRSNRRNTSHSRLFSFLHPISRQNQRPCRAINTIS